MATTTNYNFNKPTVGGSQNTWGADLNANWDSVDAILSGGTAMQPNLIAGAWKINGVAVTVSAADINSLSGITATITELNYTDGVTSNIQTQLNGKASTGTTISAGSGLTGGGSLSANRTISHGNTSSQASVNNSGNTVIQDITLDSYGHITSIGSATINTSQASVSVGSVGSYAFLNINNTAPLQSLSTGATIAGSSLRYSAAVTANYSGSGGPTMVAGGSPSGTWRCMGNIYMNGANSINNATLYLRIS